MSARSVRVSFLAELARRYAAEFTREVSVFPHFLKYRPSPVNYGASEQLLIIAKRRFAAADRSQPNVYRISPRAAAIAACVRALFDTRAVLPANVTCSQFRKAPTVEVVKGEAIASRSD